VGPILSEKGTMHRVHFRKENVTAEVPTGTNLRQACLDTDIDPYPALGGMLSCRGKGFCGTCLVEVDDTTALSEPSKRESKYLRKLAPHLADRGLRLSCQATVQGDVTVTTNPDKKEGWKVHPFYSGQRTPSWARSS
jgi:ferredoxin